MPTEEVDPAWPGVVVELVPAVATLGGPPPPPQADSPNTVATNTAVGAISARLAPFVTAQLYETRGHTKVTTVTAV